ncbi:MAG TPA: helix-turn-helix domain-containing protein [Verrucomicrobiae bacterium]|nr:helix-turn-helix domain-containing protein [Verrucomicrobiae bacterium]
MNLSEKNVSTLIELGLSPSQARVYLSLLKSNNLTAETLNKISGVTRPDVYRVLNELEKAGLAEKIISKPERFHAIAAEDCVSTLLERKIVKTNQLKKNALKLIQVFQDNNESGETEENFGFAFISEKSATFSKIKKMFRNSQKHICYLGMERRTPVFLSNCIPTLEEAFTREVECRMILPKSQNGLCETWKRLGKYSNFDLRLMPKRTETAFCVVDQNEILIATSALDLPPASPALWSNNHCIIDLCLEHFECLWLKAEKASFNV